VLKPLDRCEKAAGPQQIGGMRFEAEQEIVLLPIPSASPAERPGSIVPPHELVSIRELLQYFASRT
jgi:hypothetical protein